MPLGNPTNKLTDHFRDLAKRLRLQVHFHRLRDSHASQILLAGAHARTMQERLGHHSASFTLDADSHVTERFRDDAAEKIDAVLRGR
jgi:site-specific recombinase XerD